MSSLATVQAIDTFAQSLPYGVTINRFDGSYVKVNPSFCDICEYSAEELKTMRYADLTHPDDVAPNLELDRQLKEGEIPYFQMSKRYITKSGKQKQVLLQVSLIYAKDGTPEYYYAQVIDITDLGHHLDSISETEKRVDVTLNDAHSHTYNQASYDILEIYRRQNLRKQTHVGNVAHELKTPLNGIKGFAMLMRREYQKGSIDGGERFYGKLEECIEHMRCLIDDLLDMSFIDSGKIELDMNEFDLVSLIQNTISSQMTSAETKGLKVVFETDLKERLMTSDIFRMRQIITNLLSNAIKYTLQGSVTIKLYEHREEEGKASQLRLSVIDTGIGISAENLAAIFDEYVKVHQQSSEIQEDSTGLGLPITKKLVTLLGGSIQVESELGKGSAFTVTFA